MEGAFVIIGGVGVGAMGKLRGGGGGGVGGGGGGFFFVFGCVA